jgi:hypothetical protein
VDFDDVAEELFGLLPSEFAVTRDALASQARREGDRELATAVKQLRRPTTSAWLVNLVSRERSEPVGEVVALGASVREAQERLDGDGIRRLSQQRGQLMASLRREVHQLADGLGVKIGDAVEREFEETFDAAFADPGAGEAVRSGRLTVALSYSGFGSVELSGVVPRSARSRASASPVPAPSEAHASAAGRAKAKGKHAENTEHTENADDAEERRRRGEALAAAREAAARARHTADEQDRRTGEALGESEVRGRDVTALEGQLTRARAEHSEALERLREAEQAGEIARRASADADLVVQQIESGDPFPPTPPS